MARRASLAPVPPAAWARASSLLPNLPKLVLQPLLLPGWGMVHVLADFMCLAAKAPAKFMAFRLRAPTGRTTWRDSGRSRPPLYRDNARLGRVGCIDWARDPERHGGDDERAGQQQRTDIVADHGVSRFPRSNGYEKNAHACTSIPHVCPGPRNCAVGLRRTGTEPELHFRSIGCPAALRLFSVTS